MDKEEIVAFLINGGLVNILKVGKHLATVAWIVDDSSTPSGLRLQYEKAEGVLADAQGGRFIPCYSYVNGKLTKPSREEVAQYLSEAFGLDHWQAARVLSEAHAERNALTSAV